MLRPSTFLVFLLCLGLVNVHPSASQTQTDLNIRTAQGYRAAEAELASIYAKLKRTPALDAAHRSWIAYRDAECLYEHHAGPGGSMYPMEDAMCKTALTRQRIELMKKAVVEGYGD